MVDLNKVKNILTGLKPELIKKYPIASIGLFGPIVHGDFNFNSNIDIIMEFTSPIGIHLQTLTKSTFQSNSGSTSYSCSDRALTAPTLLCSKAGASCTIAAFGFGWEGTVTNGCVAGANALSDGASCNVACVTDWSTNGTTVYTCQSGVLTNVPTLTCRPPVSAAPTPASMCNLTILSDILSSDTKCGCLVESRSTLNSCINVICEKYSLPACKAAYDSAEACFLREAAPTLKSSVFGQVRSKQRDCTLSGAERPALASMVLLFASVMGIFGI